jgi:hypothetical protein
MQKLDPFTPLFLFVKDPDVEEPGLTPKIRITVAPTGALAGRPIHEYVAAAQKQGGTNLVGAVVSTEVSGLPAAAFRMRSTERANASDFRLLTRGWLVPRGGFMFVIEMGAPERLAAGSDAAFYTTLASIQIEK